MEAMTCCRRGFNLVEVTVAAAILAFLGLPVLSMLATGNRETMMSEDYVQAEMLASRFLEDKLALDFEALDRMVPRDETASVQLAREAASGQTVKLYREDVTLGSGYGLHLKMTRPAEDLLLLDITVSWKANGKDRKYGLIRLRGRENVSAGGRPWRS